MASRFYQFGCVRPFARHLSWFTYTGPEQEEAYAINASVDLFQTGGWDSGTVAALAAWQGAASKSVVPYSGEGVDVSLRNASFACETYILSVVSHSLKPVPGAEYRTQGKNGRPLSFLKDSRRIRNTCLRHAPPPQENALHPCLQRWS